MNLKKDMSGFLRDSDFKNCSKRNQFMFGLRLEHILSSLDFSIDYQHGITVGAEVIIFFKSCIVSRHHHIVTSEGCDEHEHRR